MALAYYGIKLSDNWIETPEGFIVFRNAVIARTGFQEYKGKELPQDELADLNITVANDSTVKVFRSPEEVFSVATIASFNCKSVTDGHPNEMLDVDTVADHEEGQVFNVRKGEAPLPSGDWPLIADIIVKSKDLIEKIVSKGLRELSCGYNYHLGMDSSGNLLQVNIIGNHVAVVPTGRAGQYAKIMDSAPLQEMKLTMSQMRKKLFALGLKALVALDATPEQIAEAMDAAKDEKEEAKPKAEDTKAKDEKDKEKDEKPSAEDAAAVAADMAALSKTFDAKVDEDEDDDEEEEGGQGEDSLEDTASTVIAPEDRTKSPVPAAVDAAYQEGQRAALKALKPFVARSKDAALKGAFDTATQLVGKAKRSGTGNGYSSFSRAAATANDGVSANPYMNAETALANKATDAYAQARKSFRK